MSKPKPKRKFAACGACRGRGFVWVNATGQRVHPSTGAEMMRAASISFCTCELGEAKRQSAKARKPWER